MALKTSYEKQDDIPEQYRDLYSERGGKYELTGIEGIKTQADVDRLNEALRKERNDHKSTKDKLTTYGDMDADKVREQLAEIEELRIRAEKGSVSDEKLEELVQARLKRTIAPIERERDQLKSALEKSNGRVTELDGQIRKGTIERALREAAVSAKAVPEAIEDMVLLGERVFEVTDDGQVLVRDQVGFTPGLKPQEWLSEMQAKRPHWWPANQGGGANGAGGGAGGGANPWAADQWNLTAQGRYVAEHGMAKAEQMARSAGSKIGAVEPTVRKTAA